MAAKPVTVLVTGFGTYDDLVGNLSYSIVTTLPTLLPPNSACQVPVRIVVHPYDIPVSYSEVRDLVPRLYDAYSQDVDIWLHLGVGMNQDSYTIEKLSRRDGYHAHPDINGETTTMDDGHKHWPDCPDKLETTLDFEDVFSRWRSKLLDSPQISAELYGVMIRRSQDPGRFIGGFLYYSSLQEYRRRKMDIDDGGQDVSRRPVLFMHVPSKNTLGELRKARLVTINLVRALAESWRSGQSREKSRSPGKSKSPGRATPTK